MITGISGRAGSVGPAGPRHSSCEIQGLRCAYPGLPYSRAFGASVAKKNVTEHKTKKAAEAASRLACLPLHQPSVFLDTLVVRSRGCAALTPGYFIVAPSALASQRRT